MKRQNIALELFQRLINKERDRPKIFKTEREGPKPLETSLKVKTPITHPTYFVLPYPNIILYIYFFFENITLLIQKVKHMREYRQLNNS